MIIDEKKFAWAEEKLRGCNALQNFEEISEPISKRMLVTEGEIPANMNVAEGNREALHAFIGSFDFCDSTVGIAIYTDTVRAATGVWVTPQKEGDEGPGDQWIRFFVTAVVKSINDDGTTNLPLFTFANDKRAVTFKEKEID